MSRRGVPLHYVTQSDGSTIYTPIKASLFQVACYVTYVMLHKRHI